MEFCTNCKTEGFDLWVESFHEEIEKLGFSLSGDEGDGTVMNIHIKNCKCFEEEE